MRARLRRSTLTSRVEIVFASPALLNASFAPGGELQAHQLEETYKLLLSTFRDAPQVTARHGASRRVTARHGA